MEGHLLDKPKAVIFDMDGTLADVSAFRHYVQGGPENYYKKDFDAFHRETVVAPAHATVVAHAQVSHLLGNKNIIVTARGSNYRHQTAMWLALNRVPSDAMYMRRQGDYRPDYEVKKDIYARLSRSFHVIHAVDDNPRIIALWEELGIPTTVVPGWED